MSYGLSHDVSLKEKSEYKGEDIISRKIIGLLGYLNCYNIKHFNNLYRFLKHRYKDIKIVISSS